ncbi:MAG: hypothetical protein PHR21_06425 [Oscillospiraceae bacterium]|nr:hypothetical protein [Oscillospiraceae bacterium]MDD4368379.1 hypothetical protein [Oscillospiraceae bacterium]
MKHTVWHRLDNASKIFPAVANLRDTKVFRLTVELTCAVNPDYLQQAASLTQSEFPPFRMQLRRGVFWYYFEETDRKIEVGPETDQICAPLYIKGERQLPFRVIYYGRRINLEVFHGLCDGEAALSFLLNLLTRYLLLSHPELQLKLAEVLPPQSSLQQRADDSFARYFRRSGKPGAAIGARAGRKDRPGPDGKGSSPARPRRKALWRQEKACQQSGRYPDDSRRVIVTEGTVPLAGLLQLAHQYDCTLTEYLCALLMYCLYQQQPRLAHPLPLVIEVPINLRAIFPSQTARNFFAVSRVTCHSADPGLVTLETLIPVVRQAFQTNLDPQALARKVSGLMQMEVNPLVSLVPIPLKDQLLKLSHKLADQAVTSNLSNLGIFRLDPRLLPYVCSVSAVTSVRRPQLLVASLGQTISLTFSSPYVETELMRLFFTQLSQAGLAVEISSNLEIQA